MLGMIVYADLRNETPDLAVLDTVAQGVAGRGTVVADRQSVPLGAMTVRLDPTGAGEGLVRRDLYDVRAGVLTALFRKTTPLERTGSRSTPVRQTRSPNDQRHVQPGRIWPTRREGCGRGAD